MKVVKINGLASVDERGESREISGTGTVNCSSPEEFMGDAGNLFIN